MNLLKSAGFLLKSLYLHPLNSLNVRGNFRISCFFSYFIKKKFYEKSEDSRQRLWYQAIHFELPVSVTDETPKITEQTKKHILLFIFAMMGSFNGKRRNFYAGN